MIEEWPLLARGILFWTSKSEQKLIYMLGNPVIWISVLVSVVLYCIFEAKVVILSQRGVNNHYSSNLQLTLGAIRMSLGAAWLLTLGWALHWFPYFLMGRQLFLHHYFPALYFGILLTACVFDAATTSVKRLPKCIIGIVCAVIIFTGFIMYAPITYGTEMSKGTCAMLKLRSKWDFNCDNFN